MSNLYENFPDTSGVYIMKGKTGAILYVGKAGNLRRRVSSYFERPHDARIQKLVSDIKAIDYEKTETAIEALILESKLIKKYSPPWNVKEKDDKSFLNVLITKSAFPQVLLVRGREKDTGERFGPFTSASSIREALRIIRKIFPFNIHPNETIGKLKKPCFDYEIGLCPGTCIGAIRRTKYMQNIRNIKLFFAGKKKQILRSLKKEMSAASKKLEFEKAEKLRRQIFALQHIQDVALITNEDVLETSDQRFDRPERLTVEGKPETRIEGHALSRIEGYDISNISGTSAVGSMVVFMDNKPDKNSYRKFKIRTVRGSHPARHALSMAGGDVGMLKEVLFRRFRHPEWPMPNLILVDGGIGQVNGFREVLQKIGIRISIVGIAKGPERKKNEFIGKIPAGMREETLIRVRDEAHRFAIKYHKELRSRKLLE